MAARRTPDTSDTSHTPDNPATTSATPASSSTPSVVARKRILIPASDRAVHAWWAAQEDPAVSFRLLVRESIEREGIVDPLNRPVSQLPRRGRPPLFGVGVEPGELVEQSLRNSNSDNSADNPAEGDPVTNRRAAREPIVFEDPVDESQHAHGILISAADHHKVTARHKVTAADSIDADGDRFVDPAGGVDLDDVAAADGYLDNI